MTNKPKIKREKSGLLVEITDFDDKNNWVSGTVGELEFEAKVYNVGSVFGINDGRVSKLHIYTLSGKEFPFQTGKDIVCYDRGWDKKPSKEFKPHFDALMKALEATPKRKFE